MPKSYLKNTRIVNARFVFSTEPRTSSRVSIACLTTDECCRKRAARVIGNGQEYYITSIRTKCDLTGSITVPEVEERVPVKACSFVCQETRLVSEIEDSTVKVVVGRFLLRQVRELDGFRLYCPILWDAREVKKPKVWLEDVDDFRWAGECFDTEEPEGDHEPEPENPEIIAPDPARQMAQIAQMLDEEIGTDDDQTNGQRYRELYASLRVYIAVDLTRTDFARRH